MALVSKCDTTIFLRKRPLHSAKSNPANMWPGMCFGAKLRVMTHMCERANLTMGS